MFIKPQRKEYSKKHLVGMRNEDNESYILENADYNEEADKRFKRFRQN